MGIVEEARALGPWLTGLRREFHANPRVSREEFWTAERIETELDRIGMTNHRRVDGTGVYALLKGEGPGGGTVALRADIDALPIEEKNTHLPYCSQVPGAMHACGHDGHITGLLGAAQLLYDRRGDFGGEVRFFFQHAEEISGGAKAFVGEGLLEGVDRAFGIHMAPDLPSGVIGVTPGPNNASVDHFTVRVQGKAAHVSTPHQGVDALYIASQIVVALQALVTRRTSPVDPVVIGVGKLRAGTSYNIVAESAELEGTTRAFSVETRGQVNGELDRLCRAVAESYGGTAEVGWDDFIGPLVNPPEVCAEVSEVVRDLFGPAALLENRPLSCCGDDFAEYQRVVPGVYAFVGSHRADDPNTGLPLHADRFDLDEGVLPAVAALHAGYALRTLGSG